MSGSWATSRSRVESVFGRVAGSSIGTEARVRPARVRFAIGCRAKCGATARFHVLSAIVYFSALASRVKRRIQHSKHRELGHTAHTKETYDEISLWKSRRALPRRHILDFIRLPHHRRAHHVARRRHVLGAPATRGKRSDVTVEDMRRALLTACTDTRPDRQQHIRDPNARIRHETIDLTKPVRRTCASDCATSALDIRIAHVSCAWKTVATELPQVIIRR